MLTRQKLLLLLLRVKLKPLHLPKHKLKPKLNSLLTKRLLPSTNKQREKDWTLQRLELNKLQKQRRKKTKEKPSGSNIETSTRLGEEKLKTSSNSKNNKKRLRRRKRSSHLQLLLPKQLPRRRRLSQLLLPKKRRRSQLLLLPRRKRPSQLLLPPRRRRPSPPFPPNSLELQPPRRKKPSLLKLQPNQWPRCLKNSTKVWTTEIRNHPKQL